MPCLVVCSGNDESGATGHLRNKTGGQWKVCNLVIHIISANQILSYILCLPPHTVESLTVDYYSLLCRILNSCTDLMKVKTNKPVSSFYDFHWIKEEYCIFLLSPPLSCRPSACWSLHPQTCRRRLWRARGWGVTRYAPKLTAGCFIFNGAAFVSHSSRLAYGGGKKSRSVRLTLLFCSAGEGRSHHQGVLRQKLPLDWGTHLCCQGCGMGSHRDGVRVLRLGFILAQIQF